MLALTLGNRGWGELPDAPKPQNEVSGRPGANAKAASPIETARFEKRKWAAYVDPGEPVPVLSKQDKMEFWLHEEVRPVSLLPLFYSAGYSQLRNTAPNYGTDSGAFGERLGAAAIRQASMRFFSDSVFPAVTGEDPRYYRKAEGSTVSRGLWAMERMFVDRSDSGEQRMDISDTMGRLAASALTTAYYPGPNRTAGNVFRTWGISIGGAIFDNELLEFWPDVLNKWRHRGNK